METIGRFSKLIEIVFGLRSDPYIDDSHITVSVRNGVVTLEGIVLDHSDLLAALRISGRISGVKALVDDLQLHRIGDDLRSDSLSAGSGATSGVCPIGSTIRASRPGAASSNCKAPPAASRSPKRSTGPGRCRADGGCDRAGRSAR